MKILDASEPEFGGPMTEDEVLGYSLSLVSGDLNLSTNFSVRILLSMNIDI
jgi:hypothetical protein